MKRTLLPLLGLTLLLSACASTDRTTSRSQNIDNTDYTRSGPQPSYSDQGGSGAHSQMFTPPPSTSTSSSTP